MKRVEKEQNVAEVTEKLSRACALYFTDFIGITVEEANELRREFRRAGIDYRVVKNTLTRKALTAIGGYDSVFECLRGPTGIAFGYDDPVGPARIIKKFYDKNKKLALKLCVLERKVYDGSKLNELAKLLSKRENIASILSSVDSPIAGVVGTIGAAIRELVGVLDAIEKQKAQPGGPPVSLA
ncbi:MAG: 50S ribosomal protein L10 [Bacteroidota bacterium]